MPIKISLVRFFLAVAEAGNIQGASEQLGRSPSAVSMALKQLEEELGGKLFESDRKSKLTNLGEFLLETAYGQVLSYDKTMSAVASFAKGELGRVEFACVPSVGVKILPGVIQKFTTSWPNVELDMRDTDTASVARALKRGTIEFGISGRPQIQGLDFLSLFEDQLVVVHPIDSPLANHSGSISWQELEKHPMIANGIFETLNVPEIRLLWQKAKLMVRNTTTLLALIRSGAGVTILPALSVPEDKAGLGVLTIKSGHLNREVGIVLNRENKLSPAAEAFITCLKEHIRATGINAKNTFV